MSKLYVLFLIFIKYIKNDLTFYFQEWEPIKEYLCGVFLKRGDYKW